MVYIAVKCYPTEKSFIHVIGHETDSVYPMFRMLLTNANITTQEMAQYDYYCWRIESYFKLLKSAGYRVESWQRETGERICKRLLI